MDPGVAFRVGKDQDQENLTSETSTAGVAIGGTDFSDKSTGEYSLSPRFEHVFIPIYSFSFPSRPYRWF